MTTYYKAVRPDLRSFNSSRVWWQVGETTRHPYLIERPGFLEDMDDAALLAWAQTPNYGHGQPARYLSATTVPTALPGCGWPLRLFEVTPEGEVWAPPGPFPHKRAALAWHVVREMDSALVLGPNKHLLDHLIETPFDRDMVGRLSWMSAGTHIPGEVTKQYEHFETVGMYVDHGRRRLWGSDRSIGSLTVVRDLASWGLFPPSEEQERSLSVLRYLLLTAGQPYSWVPRM